MAADIILQDILDHIRDSSEKPMAIYTILTKSPDTVTDYIVYGPTCIRNIPGYPILKVSELVIDEHTRIDTGFLVESDRYVGANGSVPDVDLKADKDNSILLLTNPTITYG